MAGSGEVRYRSAMWFSYLAFALLCALLALRDVGVEYSFKHPDFRLDPISSLFFACSGRIMVQLAYWEYISTASLNAPGGGSSPAMM